MWQRDPRCGKWRPDPLKAVVLFLAAAPLAAHDFWIEPTSFRPEVGVVVGFALRVGEGFRGDPVPRSDERIVKFVLASSAGERPIDGVAGADPAGAAPIREPGFQLAGYRSRTSRVDLPAEKFEKYLKEEGLETIIALRAKRGESGKPSKEIYSRCAKSLLDAGGSGTAGYDRVLGFTLEIVPERSPSEIRPGTPMPVRLLYRGKPLAGALVVARNRDEPGKPLSSRSNESGRVSFALPRGGVWLVKAVHMIPAPPRSGAEWESLWASLTFEIP